jgi:thiamine biosynthesis lipoprotein
MPGPILLAALLLAPEVPGLLREIRVVMGTTADVRVSGASDPTVALDAAFGALDEVDRAMSLWKESELTALNRAGSGRVSDGLFSVLEDALVIAALSGGAFDPTVEPLVRATGGLGGPHRRLSAPETKRLLARVGFRRVRLDPHARSVALEPGTALDLGGIAKGYAVDRALTALRAAGAQGAVVDLGRSSLGVFGDALALDVADPEDPVRPPWAWFVVREAAVGSSGADQRKDHIIDPRTGRPARRVLAATVVAAEAMEADALSTAVFVLGPDDGLALLERRGAAGFVLLKENGRRVAWTTRGFAETHQLTLAPGVLLRPAER